MIGRSTLGKMLASAASVLALGAAAPAPTGVQHSVAFDAYTPLSGNAEITRRLLTPLTGAEIRKLAAQGKALRDQPVDLSQERFELYVPPNPPPSEGYALMVFVAPWDGGKIPQSWLPVLDRFHVIFVSAARSGNDQSVHGRREPLAVLAAFNVMRRYPVNPRRVYVAGFSGGSRTAMHLAVGYPDLFTGAFLDAGADPLGNNALPVPPRELMTRLQENTRFVYVSGEHDQVHVTEDSVSQASLRRFCVFGYDGSTTPGVGHTPATSQVLAHAIQELDARRPIDDRKLIPCRAALDANIAAELAAISRHGDARQIQAAKAQLLKLDGKYGGLAAPDSVDLWKDLGG